jgi:hypothetical protein
MARRVAVHSGPVPSVSRRRSKAARRGLRGSRLRGGPGRRAPPPVRRRSRSFTPFGLNSSPEGQRATSAPRASRFHTMTLACPRDELVEGYLVPLARLPELASIDPRRASASRTSDAEGSTKGEARAGGERGFLVPRGAGGGGDALRSVPMSSSIRPGSTATRTRPDRGACPLLGEEPLGRPSRGHSIHRSQRPHGPYGRGTTLLIGDGHFRGHGARLAGSCGARGRRPRGSLDLRGRGSCVCGGRRGTRSPHASS